MQELIISADSHVIEVPDLWEKGMPQDAQARAPKVYFDEKKDAWLSARRRSSRKPSVACSWPGNSLTIWKISAGPDSLSRARAVGTPLYA